MGVSCIKVYYCKAFWVLWVLRKTQCTFPAGNRNSALLGVSAPSVILEKRHLINCPGSILWVHPLPVPAPPPPRAQPAAFCKSRNLQEGPLVTYLQGLQTLEAVI